jgi:hypothetical protein
MGARGEEEGPLFQWRAQGIASGVLVLASLVAMITALSIRMGTESQSAAVTDPALRLVSSAEVLDDAQASRSLSVPVVELGVATGTPDRVSITQLCFPSLEGGAGVGFVEALRGLEAGWIRTSGGARRALVKHDLSALAAQTATVWRQGQPCVRLPPLVLDAQERGTHQALLIAGTNPNSAWLRSGPMIVVTAAAPVLADWEVWLSLLMVGALGLRLWAWGAAPAASGLTRLRMFDVFACVMAVAMGWGISVAAIGKEPDVGLRTLVAGLVGLLPLMVFPRIIAGRRHPQPRVALRLVAPKQGLTSLWLWAGGGVALGAVVVGVLGALAPRGASHIQDIALLPGGVLALCTVWLLGAWFDEYFYRGFIFGAAYDRFGAAVAIGVAAVVQVGFLIPQRWGYVWPAVCMLVVAVAAGVARWKTESTASGFALSLGYRAALVVAVYQGWLSAGRL